MRGGSIEHAENAGILGCAGPAVLRMSSWGVLIVPELTQPCVWVRYEDWLCGDNRSAGRQSRHAAMDKTGWSKTALIRVRVRGRLRLESGRSAQLYSY